MEHWNLIKIKKKLELINWKITTPTKKNVLRPFENLKPMEVKVVIVGQDPYYTEGVANGLAFATNKNIKTPKSLQNIFKEVKEAQGCVYADQTLTHWENQGVLLVNMSLTTQIGTPNAHKKIWQQEMIHLLSEFSKKNLKVIWVLWGKEAQKIKPYLVGGSIVIEDAHPSPLSFYKKNKNTFLLLNKYIKINW